MEPNCRYDIEGFIKDLRLPLKNVANFYTQLIKEIDSQTSTLKNLLAEKDWPSIKRVLHDIKGVCANYRIVDLAEEASSINNALANNNLENINQSFDTLFLTAADAVTEIRNFFLQKGFSVLP